MRVPPRPRRPTASRRLRLWWGYRRRKSVWPAVFVAATVGLAVSVALGLSRRRPAPEAGTVAPVRALPALPQIPLRFEGVTLDTYLSAWVPYAERDELLRSPVLSDPAFAERVHWWMRYWTGPAAGWFPDFLARMAWLGTPVDSALAAYDLPPSLRYLPLIESGYSPGVSSSAAAVGLWQLMAPTARGLGLEVSPLLDERRHIEKSTRAALEYIESLHREFDSWFLTLAAYNSGPTRVRGILRRDAPGEPRTDSLFWALRGRFAPETRDFVPKLFGAMWVASRPEAYGFERPSAGRIAYDTVRVPDQTTLDVVARAAGVPYEEVARLNTEFVRGITPAGRSVSLKVPAGHGDDFLLHYPLIPDQERVTFVEHVVAAGETLAKIALRYGVRTGDIEQANPTVRARSLPVGARLTVPVAPRTEGGS